MTENEAIIELKIALDAKGTGYGCLDKDTVRMAIKALEKQIPKKVVRFKLRPTEWGSGVYCPVCESEQTQIVFFNDDGTEPDEKISWCSECGQKLDWVE